MRNLHIAIDLGSTSGRVVVGDLDELNVVHRFTSKRVTILESQYWDILGIFTEIKIGLMKAFSMYGAEIKSIGIDTWGVDYGLLDAEGVLVSPVFHYRDNRTKGLIEEVSAIISKERLYRTTGIALLSFNSLYQLYAQQKKHPDIMKAAKHFLDIPDLLAFFLTGIIKNEITHASTTALLNPTTKNWAWDIIDILHLPQEIFGEIIPSGTILGPLNPDLAMEIGAPKGVIVIACASHDTASAVSWINEDAFISSGTWSLMGMNLDSPVLSREAMQHGFTNEIGGDGRITFLQNLVGMWISNECIRAWGEERDWRELDEETESCIHYQGFIDPTDEMFMAPSTPASPMPERVKENLCANGFSPPEKRGEYLLAIYRGLAKAYSNNISLLRRLTGKKIDTVRIVGGGSRNKLLNRLTEEACCVKVYAGPTEATSLGNMLYQTYACSEISCIEEGIQRISE
jgi:rhamnulokinase